MTRKMFIELNGFTLDASDEDLEDMTLALAEGKVKVEALAIWFRQRVRPSE